MNKKIFKIKTCRGIEKFVEISSCVDGETKLYLLESVEYGECVPAIIVREKKDLSYYVEEYDWLDSLYDWLQENQI